MNQAVKALGLDVEHFVLHDFRRTATVHLRSIAEQVGGNGQTGEASADNGNGNASGKTERHDAAEQRRQLQAWADFVDLQIERERGRKASATGV